MKSLILLLHPTQLSIGHDQVVEKAHKLKKMDRKDREQYLKDRPVPVIIGPGKKLYLIDHHHLCSALYKVGEDEIYIEIKEDWSHMNVREFWSAMDQHNYLWHYDEHGQAVNPTELPFLLPSTILDLKDDPFRSLAGFIRNESAYTKVWVPFTEFKWANFLRTKVGPNDIKGAIKIAKSSASKDMPGYIGS
jgi:hypothetical protein